MALVIGMKEIALYCNKILQLSQNYCNIQKCNKTLVYSCIKIAVFKIAIFHFYKVIVRHHQNSF